MTVQELRNWIVYYIENNKVKNDIEYSSSLTTIDMLIKEIYEEYIEVMKKEQEN